MTKYSYQGPKTLQIYPYGIG